MDKNDLLKVLAEDAYNIGFGAKKHFATYDILEKYPGWVSLVSIGIGIFALFVNFLTNNVISATLIIIGVTTIYIERYSDKKDSYCKAGVELTNLFNKMKQLYFHVKNLTNINEVIDADNERIQIVNQYNAICISKQICFSDWYAHYKFFWQHQIEWIDEQKKFRLLRDKIPLSFWAFIILVLVIGVLVFFKTKGRM
ncbi:MAG: SLATT domain-containing protein [Burkholderiales bacterium]|nr:SLATT domain-containing protein [Burkholderiales bacterium]MBX9889744.1 SLATT domain-containing protein [Amoebophilaceae bacterium]